MQTDEKNINLFKGKIHNYIEIISYVAFLYKLNYKEMIFLKAYEKQDIRNVCVLGHGGVGKTSLTEAMLFLGQGSERLGKVVDGNTSSDYDVEEVKRKISIYTTVQPLEWKNKKINILDTPGFFDFEGEVLEAARVSDAAIIVATAKTGVQVGTELAWKVASKRNIPKIIFVSKMEEEFADYNKVLDGLKNSFGKSIAPFYVPMFDGEKFCGYVNVIKMEARKFEGDKIIDIPVPENLLESIAPARQMIIEAVAETSEELMNKFFDGIEFTQEEIQKAIKQGLKENSITPVLCGSAFTAASIRKLLDAVIEYFPSPDEAEAETATKPDSEDVIEISCDESAPLSAIVFKTIADPFVGKLSFVKVCSGVLKPDSTVYNPNRQLAEKIGKIYYMRGKKQIETAAITAGDIGAIPKLTQTKTGDTLCAQSNPVILEKIEFPTPQLTLAILPKEKGDEEKISAGLSKLKEEDMTLKVVTNKETKQTLISGMGDSHLDIIVNKLKDKFKVAVELKEPKIAYREAIKKRVEVEGKHKKQSGGHGQYGHVKIAFEPCESSDLIFEEKVFGGSVPKNYFPAVEKGLNEACQHGVVAGCPVVNLKATLLDGSYHPVDSSEMAFKLAASLAFKNGLAQANPVLLEPVNKVEVYVPSSYMGDVIGDINKRRGRVLGMNPQGDGIEQVVAEVPAAELTKYAIDLRSMTQARGKFTQEFVRYEEAPPAVTQKVTDEYKKATLE